MISKETFIKTMERLESLDNKMSKVDDAMREIDSDFCGFYITEPFDIVINLLEEMFNDTKTNWISYFVFERDWLHKFELGDIEIGGYSVVIKNWGDVYDFLISEMRD